MSNQRPKTLVTGATGTVGSALVRLLRGLPEVEVVAAERSIGKASHLGVKVVYLDLAAEETLEPALQGIDRAFMVTGYTVDMLRQSKAFVNAARRSNVQHIVHLGACGNDDTRVAHWGWHQFVERYIEWAGFSFTHLRPDIFMQNLLSYGGTRAVNDGLIRHYVGAAKISWVDADDVAAVAAQCLLHPEVHQGKTYRLASDVKSYDEVAKVLTDVVGKQFRYEARPAEEFLAKVIEKGGDHAYMYSAYENYAQYSAGKSPEPGAPTEVLATLLKRSGVTWLDFATRYRSEFDY